MYLRRRLYRLNENESEFADGGLLLADHIINNEKIGLKFKQYLKERVCYLVSSMINDYYSISFMTIFDELDVDNVIEKTISERNYISEKFNSYLINEAIKEINEN